MYQNIDTHSSLYRYILLISMQKRKKEIYIAGASPLLTNCQHTPGNVFYFTIGVVFM
jgi:hypothetical protein